MWCSTSPHPTFILTIKVIHPICFLKFEGSYDTLYHHYAISGGNCSSCIWLSFSGIKSFSPALGPVTSSETPLVYWWKPLSPYWRPLWYVLLLYLGIFSNCSPTLKVEWSWLWEALLIKPISKVFMCEFLSQTCCSDLHWFTVISLFDHTNTSSHPLLSYWFKKFFLLHVSVCYTGTTQKWTAEVS